MKMSDEEENQGPKSGDVIRTRSAKKRVSLAGLIQKIEKQVDNADRHVLDFNLKYK